MDCTKGDLVTDIKFCVKRIGHNHLPVVNLNFIVALMVKSYARYLGVFQPWHFSFVNTEIYYLHAETIATRHSQYISNPVTFLARQY